MVCWWVVVHYGRGRGYVPNSSSSSSSSPPPETRGVTHCGLAIYIFKKSILRQKEELRKLKYFTMQKYNLKKNKK
jgi:hypothetical protein